MDIYQLSQKKLRDAWFWQVKQNDKTKSYVKANF